MLAVSVAAASAAAVDAQHWNVQTLLAAASKVTQQPLLPDPDAVYDVTPCREWCGMPERPEPMQCGVFWFLHVPKTGGTTLMKYFHANAEAQGWTYADMWKMKLNPNEVGSGPLHWATWNQTAEWQRVVAALNETTPKVLVHAHHNMPGLGNEHFVNTVLNPIAQKLASKGCELRFGAVLREPVEHVKSAAFFGEVRTPEDMARYGPRNTNPMAKYLVYNYQSQWPVAFKSYPSPPGVDDALLKSSSAILASFSLIGRTEDIGGFIRRLNIVLGWPEDMQAERENTTPNNHQYKLSDKETARLRQLNILDNKVYQQFCTDGANSVCGSRSAAPVSGAPSLSSAVIHLDLPFRSTDEPHAFE